MKLLCLLILSLITFNSFSKSKIDEPVFIEKIQSFVIKYFKGGIIEVTYTSPKESNGVEITLLSGIRTVKAYYIGKINKGQTYTLLVNALIEK